MTRTAYVLFRQVFDGARRLTDQDSRDPRRRVALGTYLELSAAEARLGQLMQRMRRTANPFAWHHRLTVDHVLGLSVSWRYPPQADWQDDDMEHWYEQEAPHLTDDERAKVWALFDARPAYGIYEVPLGDG